MTAVSANIEPARNLVLDDRAQSKVLALTHDIPFGGFWVPYLTDPSAAAVSDLFAAGDILAVGENGSISPLQPVCVGFCGNPNWHVMVYVGAVLAGNPRQAMLSTVAPAAVFWCGTSLDQLIGEWSLNERSRPVVRAAQQYLDLIDLLVIPGKKIFKPVHDGGNEVH